MAGSTCVDFIVGTLAGIRVERVCGVTGDSLNAFLPRAVVSGRGNAIVELARTNLRGKGII